MSNKYSIIDPTSLSYESIKSDLISYLNKLPEYAKWKDYFESGAGMTLLELLSGLGSFLSFHSLGARRESYLDSCRLYTSAVNICNMLGYPVNRVSAPRVQVSFTTSNSFFWDRTIPMFTYKNRSFSLLSSQTIPAGDNTLEFVVGDWNTLEITSEVKDKFATLLVLGDGIDNNTFGDTVELYISGGKLDLIKYADTFLPTNVMLKTYPGGVALVFGDGKIGYQLRVNDAIKFNYISTLGALPGIGIDTTALVKNIDAEITGITVLNPGYAQDSIEKLAALAPAYLTAKRRMVTGPDHVSILKNYSGSLISGNWKKDTDGCCTILLSYLFDDEHYLSTTEKISVLNFLDDYKMVGERILLTNPQRIGVELKLVAIVEEGVAQADIETAIRELVGQSTMQLGNTFHIGQITQEVSKLDGVSRVYLVRPVSDKTLAYQEYLKLVSLQVIVTTNKNYVVEVSPDNSGYWHYWNSGLTTGAAKKKLVDVNAVFTMCSLVPGSLIVNATTLASAKVVEVLSDIEILLDQDIFKTVGDKYDLYEANVLLKNILP